MDRRDRVTGPGARSALRLAILACVLAPLAAAQAEDLPQHPALAAIKATFERCQLPAPDELPDQPCMAKTTKTVDALLNRVYGQIVAGLKRQEEHHDDDTLKRLIASQRVWVRYREVDCQHTGPDLYGSVMDYNIWASCEFKKRVDRVNQLYWFYSVRFPEIADKR